MNKTNRSSKRDRMIHIRLDEATHRKLKVDVAESGTTIQQLVEGLIRRKYENLDTRKVQP